MRREIITSNGKLISEGFDGLERKGVVRRLEGSKTQKNWNKLLQRTGLYVPNADAEESELFDLIKSAFELEHATKIDVSFKTGYVYSESYENSVKHSEASRAYSTSQTVYIDQLLSSVLFDYIAVYYLWATNLDDLDVYGFCFKKALYLLDSCYRKGNMVPDESKSEIIEMIAANCVDAAPSVISDVYWSTLAFAMCHEIAHIHLGHTELDYCDKNSIWEMEYAADELGNRVFLNFVNGKYREIDSQFFEIFNTYVYTAPQILFLFYEDLYFMGQWMYGELPGDSHPDLKSRIERMLVQSEDPSFDFDTEEGNALLASHWNISDLFREEFFLKLKNGKLEEVKRKGASTTMANNGYEEAYAFDEAMCSVVRELARENSIPENKAVGLWNILIQIDVVGGMKGCELVWRDKQKTYSTKALNVFYNQKAVLEAVIEFGLSLTLPNDATTAIRFALLILYNLYKISTVELSDDMAKILIECHKKKAYRVGIGKKELVEQTGVSEDELNRLEWLSCVRIDDGKVYLKEKVAIRSIEQNSETT